MMGIRVNKITITLDVYVDFEGSHESTFSYVPGDDDALAILAIQKHEAILIAAAKASDQTIEII
jgi:hypothetical protein